VITGSPAGADHPDPNRLLRVRRLCPSRQHRRPSQRAKTSQFQPFPSRRSIYHGTFPSKNPVQNGVNLIIQDHFDGSLVDRRRFDKITILRTPRPAA
jgi:hypothetical protein